MLTRHIRESLQVTPGPFPDFWVGPGDEAMCSHGSCLYLLQNFAFKLLYHVHVRTCARSSLGLSNRQCMAHSGSPHNDETSAIEVSLLCEN